MADATSSVLTTCEINGMKRSEKVERRIEEVKQGTSRIPNLFQEEEIKCKKEEKKRSMD